MQGIPMGEWDEIIKEFLVESSENLDQLDQDFIELEKNPSSKELLSRIFRAIHTVKGTSGVLGFPKLESVAHVGENLLSLLRDGEMKLDPELISGLLAMVDAIREMLRKIEASASDGDKDYSALIERLSALKTKRVEAAAQGSPKIGQILVDSGAVQKEQLAQAVALQADGDPRRLGEILIDAGAVKPREVLDALQVQTDSSPGLSSSNLRVDVTLLDKLMNLVGELVLARNQVLQFTAAQQDAAFLSTAQRLNLITTELQEGVMKTRMQPIGNLWNRLPRVVRDLAVALGKKVRVEMDGSETELDKTILEAIKDPLTHIVRNAVDHGIEMPGERVQAGKSEEGTLRLHAYHEGGQVNIEISDDGSGINLSRLKQKALEKGLITGEAAARMPERELLNLIFLPGFSTAQNVTNISGRGVGMDVVKTNIEKIGGVVDLHSDAGQGTTIKIKIPLTLAIIPALIASSGGERFAIPQVSLLELVRLEGDESRRAIEKFHGAPVYRLRGNLLPLVYLNRELKLRDSAAHSGINIVVLQADGRQFGLVVDEINDTEEIVVKPLGKQLKGISCFAGATIMGDGRVALILDVMGIAQIASVITEVHEGSTVEMASHQDDTVLGRDAWLVFTVAGSRRMAIPLSMVSRLEEFPVTSLEHSGNELVVQYRGMIMPLIDIAKRLNLSQSEKQTETLQVIVYSDAGRSVGLIVDQIVDIVDQAVKVEQQESASELAGSAVIQEKVTDLLNLAVLVKGTVVQEMK
jgi:two-component system, chemotaxis family, sensor kinase CheA